MKNQSIKGLISGFVLAVSVQAQAAAIDEQTGVTPVATPILPVREETIRGTIASIDERNDKVTVRLPSDETTDLKVEDGLLFNALRYGDAVQMTVRTVGNSKEIVSVIRE